MVGDIGLRLQEGVQDLKIGQQLAPTRDAISKTLATGSTNFFKAVEGVKGRWMARSPSTGGMPTTPPDSGRGTPVDLGKDPDTMSVRSTTSSKNSPAIQQTQSPAQQAYSPQIGTSEFAERAASTLSGWGSGIGSFISTRASKFSLGAGTVTTSASAAPDQLVPRDLDAEREREKLPIGQQKT